MRTLNTVPCVFAYTFVTHNMVSWKTKGSSCEEMRTGSSLWCQWTWYLKVWNVWIHSNFFLFMNKWKGHVTGCTTRECEATGNAPGRGPPLSVQTGGGLAANICWKFIFRQSCHTFGHLFWEEPIYMFIYIYIYIYIYMPDRLVKYVLS